MSIPGLDALSTDATDSLASNVNTPAPAIEAAPNGTANDEQKPDDVPQTSSSKEEIEPPAPTSTKLCGVCKEKEGKYKCSRCYLPYCSVSCSKQHNASHPADEPRRIPTPQPAPAPPITNPRLGTTQAAGYKGPFAVLDEAPELKSLFAQFPDLPKQLEQINQATMRPEGEVVDFAGNGLKRKDVWNQDKGWQKGVDALKRARGVYGKDGEGVREYGRLVLQLLNRDGQGEADAAIRKELDDESTQIIRQLLEMEKRER